MREKDLITEEENATIDATASKLFHLNVFLLAHTRSHLGSLQNEISMRSIYKSGDGDCVVSKRKFDEKGG